MRKRTKRSNIQLPTASSTVAAGLRPDYCQTSPPPLVCNCMAATPPKVGGDPAASLAPVSSLPRPPQDPPPPLSSTEDLKGSKSPQCLSPESQHPGDCLGLTHGTKGVLAQWGYLHRHLVRCLGPGPCPHAVFPQPAAFSAAKGWAHPMVVKNGPKGNCHHPEGSPCQRPDPPVGCLASCPHDALCAGIHCTAEGLAAMRVWTPTTTVPRRG